MTPTETICPPHLRASIEAFVLDGRPVGGFLRSVLENDLRGAITRADEINLPLLPAIVMYVTNHVPVAASGSVTKVEAWIARCRNRRNRVTFRYSCVTHSVSVGGFDSESIAEKAAEDHRYFSHMVAAPDDQSCRFEFEKD